MKVKDESEKVGLKLNIQKTKIMAPGPITSWQIDGETMEIVTDFLFLVFKITADGDCSNEIKRCLPLGTKAMTNLDSTLKSRDIAKKGPSSQSYSFSSSHVWMWELDHKESWTPKNLCFWPVVLEKTLESLLDCKEIQPLNPKANQSWIFIRRTDGEAEAPILWLPDMKTWLMVKGRRKRGWQMMRCLDSITDSMDWIASLIPWTWVWASSGTWWWTLTLGVLQSMGSQSRTPLNWTEPNIGTRL